jgi:UDP-2,4-diacetamido-2,4,6-trideoxy-beta-L-altropyranose hydrolase
MNPGPLLFRADAGVAIGTGHVMRCLALAQAWQDAGGRALFAMAESTPAIHEKLLSEACAVFSIPVGSGTPDDARNTAALATEHDASWVVVDGYQFSAEYQHALKTAGHKLLFIDDYGHAAHYYADLVLNQNLPTNETLYRNREPQTRLLLGPRCCMLRREFRAWREWERDIRATGNRVLVTMGGSDPENVTAKAIEALSLIQGDDLEATVVVGGSNPRLELLERLAGKASHKIVVRSDVSNIAEWMSWADVAISAAGSTCWELCWLALPALLVDVADNQTPVARELDRRGCALHLGSSREVSAESIAAPLMRLLKSAEERGPLSRRSHELVDGEGAARVVSALRSPTLRLRPAQKHDMRLLWEWANDPAVRAASFSSGPISWETHRAWFTEKLRQKKCLILIAEDDAGTPVGQVRFDPRDDGGADVNVSLAKASRGRGLASSIIESGVQEAFRTANWNRIHAFIKPENAASQKAFEKAGFAAAGTEQIRGNAALQFTFDRNRK